ncbi:MAG: SRPBCC family protein [Ktedonobacterales bacterium]|nr:SRPBCC family protein [Ktedonobacterales bacterium]
MDLSGSQKFNAPPQQVWNALMNPTVLKETIPGAQDVQVSGNSITMTVNVSLPVLGSNTFVLGADIQQQTPPSHAVLAIDRSGSFGSIKGHVTIDLAPVDAGTNLTYTAHLDLGGRVGMADNPIGQQAAKSGLNSFFKNLETKV